MTLSLNPILSSKRDEKYVGLVYRAILGRQVDPSGLDTYVSELASGKARSWILRITRNSDEGKSRPQGPNATANAVAMLLFREDTARLLVPVIAEALARGGKEREDAVWAIIERHVDTAPRFLSEEGERLLASDCPGWLEEFRNDEISGFLFGQESREVDIYVNGAFVASTRADTAHRELSAAGIEATRFRLPFSASRLSSFAMSTMTATTGGRMLWPQDRFVSPWLSRTLPVMEKLELQNFQTFQLIALQKPAEETSRKPLGGTSQEQPEETSQKLQEETSKEEISTEALATALRKPPSRRSAKLSSETPLTATVAADALPQVAESGGPQQ